MLASDIGIVLDQYSGKDRVADLDPPTAALCLLYDVIMYFILFTLDASMTEELLLMSSVSRFGPVFFFFFMHQCTSVCACLCIHIPKALCLCGRRGP